MSLLLSGDFSGIKNKINIYGTYNILGGNRYNANWNELYRLSIFLVAPIAFLAWSKSNNVNKRVLLFIICSLIFCFIPSFKFSSGIASLISYDGIVNRYYFASFIFLFPFLNVAISLFNPFYFTNLILDLDIRCRTWGITWIWDGDWVDWVSCPTALHVNIVDRESSPYAFIALFGASYSKLLIFFILLECRRVRRVCLVGFLVFGFKSEGHSDLLRLCLSRLSYFLNGTISSVQMWLSISTL